MRKLLLATVVAASTLTMAPATAAPAGTNSLAAVLTSDGNKFDRNSGDFDIVTEAALEVGYNSLSHFSAAFHETFGCCPGLYPIKTPTQRT